jgi:ketosteroid isomerase-like protein
VGGVPEDNVAILRRGFASFGETGSPDPTTLDPELEIINFESFPVTRPYHGLEGLMQWLADISEPFDAFKFELVEVLAHDDEHVVTAVRASGTSRTGGPPFELEWGAIYSFRRGRLVRAEGFRTPEEALLSAGL